MTPDEQTVVNAIPATGEIKYDALRTALVTSGKVDALAQFHQMRRSEKIKVRTAIEAGELVMYVSRA